MSASSENLSTELANALLTSKLIKKTDLQKVVDAINEFETQSGKSLPDALKKNASSGPRNNFKKLMPFNGYVDEKRCICLNINNGLYSQCNNPPNEKLGNMCKTCCSPNGKSGLTKKDVCGTIHDRISQYEETGDINHYRAPSIEVSGKNKPGPLAKSLGKVIEELNTKREKDEKPLIDIQDVMNFAEEKSHDIPEDCWKVVTRSKGRQTTPPSSPKQDVLEEKCDEIPKKKSKSKSPKKIPKIASDDDDSDEEPEVPKKKSKSKSPKKIPKMTSDDEDDEEEPEVPKKKSKSKSPKKIPKITSDDDSDYDEVPPPKPNSTIKDPDADSDDDEVPPPKRKSKSKSPEKKSPELVKQSLSDILSDMDDDDNTNITPAPKPAPKKVPKKSKKSPKNPKK